MSKPYADAAMNYFDKGWTGPLPTNGKHPLVSGHHGFPDKFPFPTREQVSDWAEEFAEENIALRAPMNVIGIDVDAYEAKNGGSLIAELEAKWGKLPSTYRSTARKNNPVAGIRWFRVPEGTSGADIVRYPKGPKGGIEIIRPGIEYGVVPPSIHPKVGAPYIWLHESDGAPRTSPRTEDLTELPARWLEGLTRIPPNFRPAGDTKLRFADHEAGSSAGLRILKREVEVDWPRLRDQYSWNMSLYVVTKRLYELVAGGELEDGTVREAMIRMALDAEMYSELGEHEQLAKLQATVDSARNDGLANPSNRLREEGTMATGELRGTGSTLELRWMTTNEAGEKVVEWALFADFNMKVLGEVMTPDGELESFNIELLRERDGRTSTTLVNLPINVLHNPAPLTKWLMSNRCAIVNKKQSPLANGVRLFKYLESQNAPAVRIVPFWGWDDTEGAFVTDKGVITPLGLEANQSLKPDPALARANLVNRNYGFQASNDEAAEMLREVLTFQDATVTSVFGAWWVACKLKGQIMKQASLFPIFAVEATAESGKTKGFFEEMYYLDGSTKEPGFATAAAIRDMIKAHRNGYVWMDDLREIDDKMREVFRNATAEKEHAKKDADATGNVGGRLVAPILLTGEGFGFDDEKAMPDRVIAIDLPDAKQRRSLRDPSRAQWDDIIAFHIKYPDRTRAAGTLVAMILQHAELVHDFREFRHGTNGRFGDKMAILRLGAEVLARITEDRTHVTRVDAWIDQQHNTGNENALTKLLVPTALSLTVADAPLVRSGEPHYGIISPVLIRPDKDGVNAVWVNTKNLALWWERRSKAIDTRTHTQKALEAQAKALGMKGQTAEHGKDWYKLRVKYEAGQTGPTYVTYQRVPDEIGLKWIEESGGTGSGALPGPERSPEQVLRRGPKNRIHTSSSRP